ncbi:DSBA-like thioredoxin domain protein [Cordyceps fumosorosea ARSEF 2679]|uniref:DSBA-like thioredoxin domain protein n=1 Tax=Cordyceps fumosorosea (strain ARSEF 2679) TaxID=1081104 RepID=A0A167SCZ2_CORFA|nr:DSBA-like thioredoxin domain protein [Cordyceps fumosorosea ARSEF 2679]OAA59502.1 DSBA-like thioredoxin domain protein [Cordyceps fumosorosea ARSEF 2679]
MTTATPAPSMPSPPPTTTSTTAGHKPIPASSTLPTPPAAWDVRSWQDPATAMLLPQVSTQRMLIPVEVYVDFICPWCYISMRSLEAAMDAFVARHPEVEFEVHWRPFYVAPMLRRSRPTLDFYAGAVPEEDKLRALLERIRVAGVAHGLAFDYAGRVGPTRDAHKLAALAARRGGRRAQALMVERLMRAGLVEARDISDAEVLAQVAASEGLGLDRADVFLELADEDASRRVDREVENAREVRGIEAVPCVTVLSRFKVGGFQDSQVFTDLFTKIYDEKIAQ